MTPLPRPEQVRAQAYLKRKGTDAPIELLCQRIADAFADFETRNNSIGKPSRRRCASTRLSTVLRSSVRFVSFQIQRPLNAESVR